MTRSARGSTLIELLVVLGLLGLVLAMSGVGVRSLEAPVNDPMIVALDSARRAAILTGVPHRVRLGGGEWRFLPDGRALGPRMRASRPRSTEPSPGGLPDLDPLTGRAHGQ